MERRFFFAEKWEENESSSTRSGHWRYVTFCQSCEWYSSCVGIAHESLTKYKLGEIVREMFLLSRWQYLFQHCSVFTAYFSNTVTHPPNHIHSFTPLLCENKILMKLLALLFGLKSFNGKKSTINSEKC